MGAAKPFEITFPTRHTDTFAATGYVHAGTLLALTELAYAAFDEHCGVSKPSNVVAVQLSTEAHYRSPLRWEEGATVGVRTTKADDSGFEQAFTVSSASDGRTIAAITHRWVWLNVETGRRVPLREDVQQRFMQRE